MRESLVSAGTAFLSSPTVSPHSEDAKRKFLQAKGLTEDEIIASFARSRNSKTTEGLESHGQIMDKCLMEGDHAKNKSHPTRPGAPLLVIAGTATIAVGTVIYLYKAFRKYVWPWLLRNWKKFWERRNAPKPSPEQISTESQSTVDDLRYTVDKIRQILDHQQHQIAELVTKDHRTIVELRAELEAVRNMLLSRDAFPAGSGSGSGSTVTISDPPPAAEKPSWQIRKIAQPGSAKDTALEEREKEEEDEDEGSREDTGSYDVLTPPSQKPGVQEAGDEERQPELLFEGGSDSSGELVNVPSEGKLLYSECLDEQCEP